MRLPPIRMRSGRWRAGLPLLVLAVAAAALSAAAFLAAPRDAAPAVLEGAQATDTDGDRVPDAVENALLGTDPTAAAPRDQLPEDWVRRHGLDISDRLLASREAPYPVPPESPEAYGPAGLPAEYRMTYGEVYSYNRPEGYDETRQGPWDSGLDPRAWDVRGSGVPYAWLIHHGLDPLDASVLDRPVPGTGVPWTPRQAYERGLSPVSLDGDADGLLDEEELTLGTSPRLYSTAGTGVADGWLVVHGFDPLASAVAYEDTDRDGLDNLAEFRASRDLAPATHLAGGGLDPRKRSTVDGPIPDGWLVLHNLSALDRDVASRVTQRDQVDGAEASLTVLDEYVANRPPTWREETNGPWLGGTDPNEEDTDSDGLSDVEELRGWILPTASGPKRVFSDPTRVDTDSDGLSDAAERRGRAGTRSFSPTDPSTPDSDADGLLDGQEVGLAPWRGTFLPPVDPNDPDSDDDGLRDGDEAAYWHDRHALYEERPAASYPWGPSPVPRVQDVFSTEEEPFAVVLDRFRPGGDLDQDGNGNLVDPDSDNDGLLDGWEIDPSQYRTSRYASEQPRAATDPANRDTDLDTLGDEWEVRYGLFDPDLPGWNLNPAAYSSFGDGTSDADRDLDGDSITWYAYRRSGGFTQAFAREFKATNRVEFEAGSDPNRRSSSSDGLSDGWKIFWGTVYPSLAPEDRGDIYPGWPGAFAIPPDRPLPQIEEDDVHPRDPIQYRRIVPADVPSALPWEETDRVVEDFRDMNQVLRPYRVLVGAVAPSYLSAQDNATNPYMDDTDGDRMPDWWEGVYARLGTPRDRVSPVLPDGGADPDSDGLSNDAEYDARTDPYRRDSDLGGAGDSEESRAGLDPLDPNDDVRIQDSTTDTDGDGVPDIAELLGRVAGPEGRRVVTDPLSMDTDRDGLLDGRSLREVIGRLLDPSTDADKALIAGYEARGLVVQLTSDGKGDIPGEMALGSDPGLLSTTGEGIPDGWLALHSLTPTRKWGYLDQYAYGRPEWWNETRHGIWRWGLAPQEQATRDHDLDGLDDLNGEDPIPYANRLNRLPLGDPREEGLPDAETLARAQAYGTRRSEAPALPPLPGVIVRLDPLPENVSANGTTPFNGTVRFLDDSPARNVTVVLSLGTRGLILGAAVTNETGHFRGSVLLADEIAAPAGSEGVPVFGRDDAAGVHENPAALLSGVDAANKVPFFAWAYNVSPYAEGRQGEPHFRPDGTSGPGLRGSSSAAQLARLLLPTRIEITVPDLVRTGQTIPVNVTVKDALGRAVPHAVVNLTTDNRTLTADADGRIDLDLVPPAAGVVERAIAIHYNGTGSLLSSNATARVLVVRPTVLTIAPPAAALHPGEQFAVAGFLRLEDGAPVRDAPVRVRAAGATFDARTTSTGAWRVVASVPLDEPLGAMVVTADYAGALGIDAARANVTVPVEGLPRIEASDALVPVDGEAVLVARLLDASGRPIVGATVTAREGTRTLAQNTTVAEGRATLRVRFDDATPGARTLVLRFSSEAEGAAERAVIVTRTTQPTLEVDAPEAVRGLPYSVTGRLLDSTGRALAGQSVRVAVGENAARAVTLADGSWSVSLTPRGETPVGPLSVVARYAGSPDGVYLPVSAQRATRAFDAPSVALDRDSVLASRPVLEGRLTTLLGAPLAGRQIVLGAPGGETLAATNATGHFRASIGLAPGQPLGPMTLRVRLAAEDGLRGLDEERVVRVRDLGRIKAEPPAEAIQGAEVSFPFALVDSLGRAAAGATARAYLDDEPMDARLDGGLLRLRVPASLQPGPHRLRLAAESPLVEAPAIETGLLVQRETVLVLLEQPVVHPGESPVVRLRLTADGAPLAGRTILVYGAGAAPLQAKTGADGVAVVQVPLSAPGGSVDVVHPGGDTAGASALNVRVRPAEASVIDAGADARAWWLAGLAVLLLVAAALVVMRARRSAAEEVFREAARRLHSGRADVKVLYETYRAMLGLAGVSEDAAERLTFADLARRFVSDAPEAREAAGTLGRLFDQAIYDHAPLDADDLRAAAGAFDALARHAATLQPAAPQGQAVTP